MKYLEKPTRFANRALDHAEKVFRFANKNSVKRIGLFSVVVFIVLSTSGINAQDYNPSSMEDAQVCFEGAVGYDLIPFHKEVLNYDQQVAIEKDNLTTSLISDTSRAGTLPVIVEPHLGCGYETAIASGRYDDMPMIARLGAVGSVDRFNAAMINNPPTVDLVAHLSNEWVPGEDVTYNTVIAQDSGYDTLQAVNIGELWNQVRMISYALFVIALIIAGFMIMFRQKIGGQMAVTVFNTIPKVIVGLILVTFSFAIVGLVIDIGVVLVNVIESILGVEGEALIMSHPFSLWEVFRGDGWLGAVPEALGVGLLASIIGLAAGAFTGGLSAVVAGGGLLLSLVALAIIFIVLYASLKVFITLLKAWIGIIVDTVLGPLFLVIAVIPGRSSVGYNWFRRVVKNVLVFVGVYLVLNLAVYLMDKDIIIFFPEGLAGGDTSVSASDQVLNLIMTAVLPLFLFFTAAEVPSFLEDIIPSSGGKGVSTAFANVQKSMSKVPVVGSAFG